IVCEVALRVELPAVVALELAVRVESAHALVERDGSDAAVDVFADVKQLVRRVAGIEVDVVTGRELQQIPAWREKRHSDRKSGNRDGPALRQAKLASSRRGCCGGEGKRHEE